jgi:hypothetical protein
MRSKVVGRLFAGMCAGWGVAGGICVLMFAILVSGLEERGNGTSGTDGTNNRRGREREE